MLMQMLAARLFQAEDGPVVSPWVMGIIAVLLVILFIWLLLRERNTATKARGSADRMVASREAEARQNEAWVSGPGTEARAAAPAAQPVFVPPMEKADAAVAAPVIAPDDLEIIEGIGPKIALVLKNAGVRTFTQLAAMEPSRVSAILQQAGIRLADPSSWAEQARLAAAGDQVGLKALQDRLKGGR